MIVPVARVRHRTRKQICPSSSLRVTDLPYNAIPNHLPVSVAFALFSCMTELLSYEDFLKVDIRVGRIIEVEDFERAKIPAYKLKIDFGPEIGVKQTSARFKTDYTPEQLLNRQCLAVVNFPPRNIGGYMSEVLLVGVPRPGGGLVLVSPVTEADLGGRLY